MARKGGYRSFVDVDIISGSASTGECAALVMFYSRVGRAEHWREGDPVRGNTTIKKGTAIATFVNGRYPNKKHGNHAALYVSQDLLGITVVDQWDGKNAGKRTLPFLGREEAGAWKDPSNNGDAFSIIELE